MFTILCTSIDVAIYIHENRMVGVGISQGPWLVQYICMMTIDFLWPRVGKVEVKKQSASAKKQPKYSAIKI